MPIFRPREKREGAGGKEVEGRTLDEGTEQHGGDG